MTDHMTSVSRFRALHTGAAPLVLVNAWDAMSARIIEAAGAPAVATTSAGVAWSLGAPDGDALDRAAAVELVRRVCAAVSVPVTADIESGFGATPDEVAETIHAVLDAGAAGVNLEDSRHDGSGTLRHVDDQCDRLAAARAAAGTGLYINARVDTHLGRTGDLDETRTRSLAYLAAGADGVFVPGVLDRDDIAALVKSLDAPVNVMVGPGAPTVAELTELGVARISLGSTVAQAAYGLARRAADEVYHHGTYDTIAGAPNFGELNQLITPG